MCDVRIYLMLPVRVGVSVEIWHEEDTFLNPLRLRTSHSFLFFFGFNSKNQGERFGRRFFFCLQGECTIYSNMRLLLAKHMFSLFSLTIFPCNTHPKLALFLKGKVQN